ncbi:MAG: DNA cytosine methyltransferase [Patescibacteria group bacterium]
MKIFKIASLFTGCGGLDLGFKKAGFKTIWSNENDKTIISTLKYNFPTTSLDTRSILNVSAEEIPEIDGIIGGPPCQSWSEAGKGLGEKDERGKLFWEYIRVLRSKKPKFFLAENVSGILSKKHRHSFQEIINSFHQLGYDVHYELLNANDYCVAQDRKRVIIVGFRKDLGVNFSFPEAVFPKLTLLSSIADLANSAVPANPKNYSNKKQVVTNHEYLIGGFSSMYMSRNRVRSWHEPSFTIQAGGRHAPIHPNAPKMIKIDENKFEFAPEFINLYRRLTIRECLRIQTFPDNYKLIYEKLADGYKMVGNAVPVNMAYYLARQIAECLVNGKKKIAKYNITEKRYS